MLKCFKKGNKENVTSFFKEVVDNLAYPDRETYIVMDNLNTHIRPSEALRYMTEN